jgi:predicted Rossmann fold flavoprotein
MSKSSETPFPKVLDVIVLGAGGAGMMCAAEAGKRGKRVLVLDHAQKIGGKILISGGGRCNFTNTGASPAQYVSENPHFCKSALSRFPPEKFIQKVEAHGIAYHEKKLGQLFCDLSASQIVELLVGECEAAGAEILLGCSLNQVSRVEVESNGRFLVETSRGTFHAESLVVATGGLSIPKVGATSIGYEIAKNFGLALIETAPALDGFVLDTSEIKEFCALSGISVDCTISCGGKSFRENILFTHSGLSGPASLQASLHWKKGSEVKIDLLPEIENPLEEWIKPKKQASRVLMKTALSELFPARFADLFTEKYFPEAAQTLPLSQISEKILAEFVGRLKEWTFTPSRTVGYSKAEVTRGGVSTAELSSKTLESQKVPGLYFIGEVVDVTGWLGGYNFQWAWASGWAAGQAV